VIKARNEIAETGSKGKEVDEAEHEGDEADILTSSLKIEIRSFVGSCFSGLFPTHSSRKLQALQSCLSEDWSKPESLRLICLSVHGFLHPAMLKRILPFVPVPVAPRPIPQEKEPTPKNDKNLLWVDFCKRKAAAVAAAQAQADSETKTLFDRFEEGARATLAILLHLTNENSKDSIKLINATSDCSLLSAKSRAFLDAHSVLGPKFICLYADALLQREKITAIGQVSKIPAADVDLATRCTCLLSNLVSRYVAAVVDSCITIINSASTCQHLSADRRKYILRYSILTFILPALLLGLTQLPEVSRPLEAAVSKPTPEGFVFTRLPRAGSMAFFLECLQPSAAKLYALLKMIDLMAQFEEMETKVDSCNWIINLTSIVAHVYALSESTTFDTKPEPSSSFIESWIRSDLLSVGLAIQPSFREDDLSDENSDSDLDEKPLAMQRLLSERSQSAVITAQEGRLFLSQLIDGTGISLEFHDWLMAKKKFAPRNPKLDEMVRANFAAILHHHGLVVEAVVYSRLIASSRETANHKKWTRDCMIPELISAWEIANGIRAHRMKEVNDLVVQGVDKAAALDQISIKFVRSCQFLLEVSPSIETVRSAPAGRLLASPKGINRRSGKVLWGRLRTIIQLIRHFKFVLINHSQSRPLSEFFYCK